MAEDKNKLKEAELNEELLDEVSGGQLSPADRTGNHQVTFGK